MPEQLRIEALSAAHDRKAFASGSLPLDRDLQEQASQEVKRRIATCFVAVSIDSGALAGFYTLAAACIAFDALSPAVSKKLPRYPVVPAALIGRLAVANSFQGRGLGSVLLSDAIARSARADMGVFAIVVDAKDERAQRFYEKSGFTLLSGEGPRLMLPVATALQLIGLRDTASP